LSHVLAPPVGGRTRAGSLRPLLLLVVGGAAGGFLLGMVLAMAAIAIDPLDPLQIGIAGTTVLVSVLAVAWRPLRAWLPQRTCQVGGGRLLVSGLDAAAFRWGVQLGSGLRTYAVTPGLYGFLGITVAIFDPMSVLATCTIYGVIRGGAIAFVALIVSRRGRSGDEGPMPWVGLERRLAVPVLLLIGMVTLYQVDLLERISS
jgi:hypothetical protein